MNGGGGKAWQAYNPTRIVADSIDKVGRHAISGEKILLVTTKGFVQRGLVERLHLALENCNLTIFDDVEQNPSLDFLDQACVRFKDESIDRVFALGGGSALDVGKVLSLIIPCNIDLPLQKIFRDQYEPHWNARLPILTIPTTAGSGAEVTNFATVWDYKAKRKYSLTSFLLFPDIAYLDASLTITLPRDQTLYSGLDALSHALESLWNKGCTPVSRAMAVHSLALLATALPQVLSYPGNLRFRSDMLNASLLSGLAISQTKTAIAHSISYPLTVNYSIPHGLACGFTLLTLLRINFESLASNEMERKLFESIAVLLESLELDKKIYEYASFEEIESLVGEMYAPGRSDNYLGGDIGGVREVLVAALKKS